MDGTVLNFDSDADFGVIRATDGKRYRFTSTNWSSSGQAQPGDVVDFEPEESVATEIFVTNRAGEKPSLANAPPSSPIQLGETAATPPSAEILGDVNPNVETLAADSTATSVHNSVSPPSGLGVRFFIAYFLTMIPTYVLPYFGSNSLFFNGISSESMGGLPVQFWWHLSCYPVAIFLAYIRGVRIGRVWLVSFPILAGIFDLIPVLNYIPLVPTIFNFCALIIGASKSAPHGLVIENLNQKMERGLWAIAAFSAFAIFKIWTSPAAMGHGFVSALLLWPVLALAVFFALKYRAGEGIAVADLMSGISTSAGELGRSLANTATIQRDAASDMPALLAMEPAAFVFCTECGTRNAADDRYCAECGQGL